METTLNNQVAVIENSIEIFRSAPEVLQSNQEKTQKALAVGNNILEQWQAAWNIADEQERLHALATVDERSNKYLVNCGNAVKQQKELRAAITQMMGEFKKMFTTAENEIDKTKAGSIPANVQKHRDAFAEEAFKIAERKGKEAEREAAKAKEAIDLKATVELRLSNYFNDFLLNAKNKFSQKFNELTLDGFADNAAAIRQYSPKYSEKHFNEFNPKVYSTLQTPDELKAIIHSVTQNAYDSLNEKYGIAMLELKDEIVSKIPSKHAELLEQKRLADETAKAAEEARIAEEKRQAELAAANEEKRKDLEAKQAEERRIEQEKAAALKAEQEKALEEQRKREAAEAAKQAEEAEAAKKKVELEIEMNKQGEQTMVMFNQEAANAEAVTPEAKKGYEITVLHQAGYVQIFQLWFENEGKNLPIDKIGNTKLDQMKAWAEKQASKNGTKIESKFLKYEESFKAINKN